MKRSASLQGPDRAARPAQGPRRWPAEGAGSGAGESGATATVREPREISGFFPGLPQLEVEASTPVKWHLNGMAGKLVVSSGITAIAREQYARLAAALYQAQLDRRATVVLLTSSVPAEGKTLTSTNLALTLSESYRRRVLLIDADLRRPMVHEIFGVPNGPGLGELLAAGGPLALMHVTPRLSLLTAGSIEGDPMKTLSSDRMRALVDEARTKFDWVVIDTPPVGLWPDAKVLAASADISLLVVGAGSTAYDVMQRAAEALGPDRVAGVVLNRVADASLPPPYYGHYASNGRQ